MRAVLVRHGETLWNREGRHQGRIDIALSEEGEAQAEALGQRLEGLAITRAVASPLARAQGTARRALGRRDLELILDEGLMELDHGTWEGRLSKDLEREVPDLRRAWRERPHEVRLPGGETLQEVQVRAWTSFTAACEGLQGEDTLLLVTHDGVIRVLLARILGLPLSQVWSFRLAATGITLLEGDGVERLQVVRLNDASHLHPLFGEPNHRRL